MSQSTATTTKALTYLLTTLKRYHGELVQEKNLIKKEKARKEKLEHGIAERSAEWEKLLGEQNRLKSVYVRAKKELEEEEAKLDNVRLNLTKYRGQLNKAHQLANRKKKISQQAKATFESFYDKQLHLEKISQSLLLELQHSTIHKKQEEALALNRKKSIIKNEETLRQVNSDMASVHKLLMDSLQVETNNKNLETKQIYQK